MIRNKGLTLVEMMLSMAISLIVLGAAVAANTHFMATMKKIEVDGELKQEADLLNEFITNAIRSYGGGSIQPWSALWVEDSCGPRDALPNCDGSDRITIATSDDNFPECGIETVVTATSYKIKEPGGVCCIPPEILNRQVILTQDEYYRHIYITSVNITPGVCKFDFEDTEGVGPLSNLPPMISDWENGTATVVDVKTYYLDRLTFKLLEFQDSNNNKIIDPNEVKEIVDQIIDIQVAFGVDFNPKDGRLQNDQDQNDEWVHNAPGFTESLGTGGLTAAKLEDLAMISIGIIVGVPSSSETLEAVTILNGPGRTAPGMQLARTQKTVMIRNQGRSFSR